MLRGYALAQTSPPESAFSKIGQQVFAEQKTAGYAQKTTVNGGTNYIYTAGFISEEHKIDISMTGDGKVGSYRVLP